MKPEMDHETKVSRRRFFTAAGSFMTGAVVTAAGCSMAAKKEPVAAAPVVWPYPYVKVDPEEVRKRAYAGYYKGKWGVGVFGSLVSVLEEKVGYPYNVFAPEIMSWGSGGGFGTASQCGSITAACLAVNMVCDNKTAKKIILDIFNWYEQTSLPTPTAQKMANEKLFTVEKYKTTEIFTPTIANSPLCHISVERFCKANGVGSGSKERAERCARLTSDISYFTAVQLNKHVDSQYESEYAMSAAATSCRECHAKGKEMDQGGWSRGKMDCQPCHSTDHINVSEGHYAGFEKK